MNDDLARVIAHTAAKPTGGGHLGTCPCPGHETPENTLSIAAGKRQAVVVNCLSGRHTGEEVFRELRRLGVLDPPTPAAPRRPDPERPDFRPTVPGAEREAVYAYRDAQGNLLQYVVRWRLPDGTKSFCPYCRDGAKWVKRQLLDPRPLYGLDLLAQRHAAPVLVCEGEKAAEAARAALGEDWAVVTWSGGTNAVQKADWAPLEGRTVTIWPDNDEPGRKAAAKIVERVPGAVVLDVSDLDAKADAADVAPEEVRRRVDAGKPAEDAPPRFAPVSTATLCAKPLQPVEWAVEAFAPVGLAMVFAPPRVGKSTFAVQLAAAVAAGRPFLGYATTKAQALYIDAENGPRRVQGLLDRLGYPQGLDNLDLFNPPADWQLNESGLADLEHYVEAHPALKVVVLDTLQRLIPSARIKGDAYEMSVERLKRLQAWTLKHRLLVLLVHHSKKPARDAAGESFDAASGSTGLTGTCEHTFGLKRHKGDLFKLEVVSRDMAQLELAVRLDKAGWELMGDFDEHTMTEQQRALVDFIRDNEGANIKTVHRALSFPSYDAAKQACYRATREGYLIQTKRGCFRTNTTFRSVPLDPEKEQKEGIEPCFRPPARAREAQDWMSAHEQRQDAFHLHGTPDAERGGRDL